MTLAPPQLGNAIALPTSKIVWPPSEGGDPRGWWWYGPSVWDAAASRIPGVGRAVSIYSGLIKQCPLDAWRGAEPLPRPRLLDRPDPTAARSWYVGLNVEDYLLHGNAIGLVTARSQETGWPQAVAWYPASRVAITWGPSDPLRYWYGGTELPADDVVHVRRSADRFNPHRGVGVVEQYLAMFDRVHAEDAYELNALTRSSVPSVAVITPNPDLSQEEADDADDAWAEKFAVRKPVFLPYGTQITPLGWSPLDSQMVEARKLSLVDVANAFNLDGYWLGAEMKGLTYRSPGPLFMSLLRTSLEPVLVDLEQTWGDAWLPRGQSLRFDRLVLTRDDFGAMVDTLSKAIAPPQSDPTVGALLSPEEARQYLGLAAVATGAPTTTSPVDTVEADQEGVPT